MAVVGVTHSKVVTIPDDPNYPVGSDEWNAQHVITGLENVDNTSDVNKPVSTAQQAAINAGVASVTKTSIGLGNVDNTSDANKPVSTAQQAALDLKAPLASPTFTGAPAAPTPTAGDSSTKLATTAFIATSFAPLASPALTGTPTAPTQAALLNSTALATTAYVDRTTRDKLTANRTYFVNSSTGSDSNNGLASGTAFLTLQKAINVVGALDLSIFNVTISCAGAFTAGAQVNGPWVGLGTVTLQGDTVTPSNVTITVTGDNCISVKNNGTLTVQGFKLSTITSGNGLFAIAGGTITTGSKMEYGACAQNHMLADFGGNLVTSGCVYTISGGSGVHQCVSGGSINGAAMTVTLTGTPAFTAFYYATRGGKSQAYSNTYTGAATGQRYLVDTGGLIFVNGAGATYFPGSVAGSGGTTTGGGFYA